MYLTDMFTISANLAGIPAVSLPYGISGKGLPIGIQIMGKYFDEQSILNVAFALEQGIHPWKGGLPLQE
jgi:aspartyl-tRNA(Asn)/glutamyl-tRNA(Gln) amidotransferase subunit A